MRRFASVFGRRDKKEQRKVPTPDLAHSSASSSGSASISLTTPDDDQPLPLVVAHARDKPSWKSWIGPKRSASFTHAPPPPPPAIPVWQPAAPKLNSKVIDDYESDPDDDDAPTSISTNPSSPPAQAHDSAPPIEIFRILVANALQPPQSPSPFLQHNLGPLFPRSVNKPALLSPPPNRLRVDMFRKHLIAHIHRTDISPSELAEIRSLSTQPTPPLPSSQPCSFPDITAPKTSSNLFSSSPGIRRWITRPCFEDRNIIYSPTNDAHIHSHNVASSRAIAALEYPEHLDVFVDPDFDQPPLEKSRHDPWSPTEPTFAVATSHASPLDPAPVSASVHARNSYTATPSPLRNEHNPAPAIPSAMPPKAKEPAPAKSGTVAAAATTIVGTVKRVVRFAEDDSDDGTPLHVVRMKKKREQKANFLRQERLKRAKEEDELRRQREQQARQLEQEALERERKRLAIEKEKKEREKAKFAEAITATRMRRETQRTGGVVSSNTINHDLLAPSTSLTSLRDSERNRPSESRRYSTLPHHAPPSLSIPRREPSDPHLNAPFHNPNYFSDSSSPSSSRPPSIAHSPLTPEYGQHSRPPSTYSAHTSSSEDVRHHAGSKRGSLAAAAAAPIYARPPMIASYPTWSDSNPHIQYIPPVPPFPDFVTDMPLLPPTAPFMKPSYKSRSSSSSRKDSAASSPAGSRRGSFNSSSEHVNVVRKVSPHPPSSSRNPSSSPHPRHASGPSSMPAMPNHQRKGSGDSRNTTQTNQTSRQSLHQSQHGSPRPVLATSMSQSLTSRGRPQQATRAMTTPYMQGSPQGQWTTAVPMMMMVPVAAPMGYMNMGAQPYPTMPMPMNTPMWMDSRSASMSAGMGAGAGGGRPVGGGQQQQQGSASGGWNQPRTIIS